jgi:hypothetical protein
MLDTINVAFATIDVHLPTFLPPFSSFMIRHRRNPVHAACRPSLTAGLRCALAAFLRNNLMNTRLMTLEPV